MLKVEGKILKLNPEHRQYFKNSKSKTETHSKLRLEISKSQPI